MNKTVIEGELEIDHDRGVIYFHSNKTGASILRICNLPTPIPEVLEKGGDIPLRGLDITHLISQDWSGVTRFSPEKVIKDG